MWKRNLLFLGLILFGAASLASFFPKVSPVRADRRKPEPSPIAADSAIVARLDRALRARWSAEGLAPAHRAPDLAVMRRLSLGLMGTIPSLEEIRRFEALPENERLARWLDDLLKDRRFADYFAERFARAFVGTEDGPFIVYRRRRFVTWLSDQLLENRPFTELARDLIAGQGLWTDHPSTNFVSVTFDPEKKEPDPERLAARVARAFLGIRLDCAQCHDHPFQDWKQRDFQGLAAFFGQVHSGLTGIHDGKGDFQPTNRKTGMPVTVEPRVPFLPELLPQDGTRRSQLARWVTNPKSPYLPRATANRVWALLFGRPLVEPVDDLGSASGAPPEMLRILADDFAARGFDLKRMIRNIVSSEAFRIDSASVYDVTDAHEKSLAVFPMTPLRPEQVVGGLLQAASLETINRDSHIIVRLTTYFGQQAFVQRYGDTGEEDFSSGCSTIPQRLLMMNGDLVQEKTKDSIFNATTRIAMLAPTNQRAVEIAYLSVLTRRPTPEEAGYFEAKLSGLKGKERERRLSDLYWTLLNSTEFSWSH